jgi:hypothetical protein
VVASDEVVASGALRVCSLSGDGGGRASRIYRGWRWLVVGVSVSGDDLVRTKCWGRFWLPMVEPDASLAVAYGGWRPRPAWRSSADLVSWPKCSGFAGGRGSVGGGWRLLRVTSVLQCPLWIWALPVDVDVPV